MQARLSVGLNPKMMEDFVEFIAERETIRLRKYVNLPQQQWTQDMILKNHRFCNIFREDDNTTAWLRENFRVPYKNHPNLWFLFCAARYINYIPTLQKIGAEALLNFDKEFIYQQEQFLRESGDKIFTSAYMITTGGQTGMTLMQRVVEQVLNDLWENKTELTEYFENVRSLEESCKKLARYTGFKSSGGNTFMAYEVITDLRHTRYLQGAVDILTWCNVGPGATRAIHRLHSSTGSLDAIKFNRRQEWLNAEVFKVFGWLKTQVSVIQTKIRNKLGEDFEDDICSYFYKQLERFNNLEMRDVEHSLCEFDKYLRIKTGEGRTRAKYVSGRGY